MLRRVAGAALLACALFSFGTATAQIQRQVLPAIIPNARAVSTLTIASGSVTATQESHLVDTEAAAASDDLTTVVPPAGIVAGQVIRISSADAARDIVIKNGTGANLVATPGGVDILLSELADVAFLRWTGSQWRALAISGGSGGANVYATKAAAAAATVGASVTAIQTRGYAAAGDGGNANYSVLGSCPGTLKVWHIQTANSICFVLADKETTFEVFGFSTSNTAAQNDTAFDALEEALLPASALELRKITAKRDGSYAWGAMADGSVALALVNVDGVEIDFNDSSWPANFSTSRRIGFVQITGGGWNHIHSVNGSQPNFTSTATTGVDWFVTRLGAHHNFLQGKFTGGLQGYAAMGSYNVSQARSYGNIVDVETTNVYYGLANQSDGDYEKYKLVCAGSVRCVIAYNAVNNDYDITNRAATSLYTGGRANQYLFKAYGTAVSGVVNEFTGHTVKIRDYAQNDSVTLPTPIYVQHDQNEIACGSVGTKIGIDFDIDFELGTDAERYTSLIGNDAYRYVTPGTCGSGKELGDPVSGVNEDRITVTGRVSGNLAGSADFAALGLSANGIGSAALSDWAFVNFNAIALSRPFNSGQYNNLTMTGVNAPSAANNFAGTRSGRFALSNSRTASFGNTDAHYQPTGGGVNILLNGSSSSGFNMSVAGTLKGDNVVDGTAYYLRGANALMFGATTVGGGAGNYLRLDNADLYPSTASTIDLGTTQPFKDIRFTGELYTDGNADAAITPVWGNDGTANTLGNGTLSGTARKIGNRVFFDISLIFGSTTTVGSSTMFFQLPSPFNGNFANTCVGSVYVLDSGTGFRIGVSRMQGGGDKIYMVSDSAANVFNSAIPITWTTNDTMFVSGNCEL